MFLTSSWVLLLGLVQIKYLEIDRFRCFGSCVAQAGLVLLSYYQYLCDSIRPGLEARCSCHYYCLLPDKEAVSRQGYSNPQMAKVLLQQPPANSGSCVMDPVKLLSREALGSHRPTSLSLSLCERFGGVALVFSLFSASLTRQRVKWRLGISDLLQNNQERLLEV